MLTEIQNGKRVVIQSPRIEFKSPEALLEILTQIFLEFKMHSQHCISNAREARYFSLMAKSGKNKISVDTHMVNTYPDFVLAINNYNIFMKFVKDKIIINIINSDHNVFEIIINSDNKNDIFVTSNNKLSIYDMYLYFINIFEHLDDEYFIELYNTDKYIRVTFREYRDNTYFIKSILWIQEKKYKYINDDSYLVIIEEIVEEINKDQPPKLITFYDYIIDFIERFRKITQNIKN